MGDIIGLDLSLTSTGVADKGGTFRIRPKSKGAQRLDDIASEIMVLGREAELVVIEGYSFGSQGRATFSIGELGGVIRLELHRAGVPWLLVPPSVLKKWATGKGNADKDTMLETAIRKYAFEGHGNDEADAWLLYLMASEEGNRS